MNVIDIFPKTTKLTLTREQLSQCGEEKCFGYISPNNIGITTCGTRIQTDNVVAQKEGVKMRVEGDVVRVTGKIDGQEVIGVTSRKLIQPYFNNCEKKFKKFNDDKVTYYTGCKHIKFVIGNIYIGN